MHSSYYELALNIYFLELIKKITQFLIVYKFEICLDAKALKF